MTPRERISADRAAIEKAVGLVPGSAKWFVEPTDRHFTVRWTGKVRMTPMGDMTEEDALVSVRGGFRFFRSQIGSVQTDEEIEVIITDGMRRQLELHAEHVKNERVDMRITLNRNKP